MRIAYIAPYQGPGLLENRPSTMQNLGLAANLKIELVAELLEAESHTIEVLSQGEVAGGGRAKFYPAFRESKPFRPTIPVLYASALPIRRINGFWSALWTLWLFRQRHRSDPYDVVIVYNLKLPQIACALYSRRLALPVVLEYEDDAQVDISGKSGAGLGGGWELPWARKVLASVSGCLAVSPHLLSSVSASVPKALLRGVVSRNIMETSSDTTVARKNWVVFSGTHSKTKGLEQLVKAWEMAPVPGWELHIAGYGEKTDSLMKMAQRNKSIVFHGLLSREENAALLRMSKIGVNPHDLSETPGNIFAFKIIEYLAAGTHVITTPMGPLETELEAGVTYIADNSPETIAAAIQQAVTGRTYERGAMDAAQGTYGPAAVSKMLDTLLRRVTA